MIEIDSAWLAAHPLPHPGEDTDKNARGHVVVAGGSEAVPAAIGLTGEAAFRAGAGKVQLAGVERAALLLGIGFPEAAVFPLPADEHGELSEAAGEVLCGHLERCDTLVFGPGMGARSPAEAILRAVLREARPGLSLVLDAAPVAVADRLAGEIRAHHGPVVLTPNGDEMQRLMDCDEARIKNDPQALARQAADRFHATVILKLPESWIASPGEEILRYPGGGPGLATGGSGDVLAGIIGGLLSRSATPLTAAAWGVWLHGEAGRRVANRIGPLGFLARELLPEIPGLMAGAP